MQHILRAAGLAVAVSLLASAAPAATLDLDDCDAFGCHGSSISLTVEESGVGVYDVTLTLDSTGFDEGRDGVNQAGFKAINDYTSVSLVSAPDATWVDAYASTINSNGSPCAGSNPSGHICTSGFTDVTTDAEYVWEFQVQGGTLLAVSDWHIGFQYADDAGPAKGWIISATAPIPEPSAALVFAAGLGVVGLRLRGRVGRP